jgi:hypothetical protein
MNAAGLMPRAVLLLALTVLPVAIAAPTGADASEVEPVSFVSVTIDVDGEVLDSRFEDMDGDGRSDLVLAVRTQRDGEAARREIRIHPMESNGSYAMVPETVVGVYDDVILWGCGDVRDEPGRELLFMTRTGVHSYSPTLPGYKGNIRRLATYELIYQMPDPRDLPGWRYVIEQPARDLLLLPGASGMALWGPLTGERAPDATDDYGLIAEFGGGNGDPLFSVKAPGAVRASAGGLKVSIDTGSNKRLFLGDAPAAFAAMLQADAKYRAPAIVDSNGDGRQDLLIQRGSKLILFEAGPDGLPTRPTRTEKLPEYLDKEDHDLVLRLHDLDADGDTDLLAWLSEDADGIEKRVFNYFVLLNDGTRMLPAEPDQVLRFKGSATESEVTDVDDDGRPDLVITKYELPELTDVLTGFNFRRSAYVYFAADKQPFDRKPALRDEQSFDIESLQDALVRRRIAADLSGDRIADLVEVDLSGRVAIRRLGEESSFFGGSDWTIEDDAWKRFEMGADVSGLEVTDLNGDGIADLVNPGEHGIWLMLSRRGDG